MSNLSDIIEDFINELIESTNNSFIEIQRNMLAQQFDCSPSQINYVLSTRFNSDKGYIIESRRGGGGYVKIFKVDTSSDEHLENILNKSIGDSITLNRANDILNVFNQKGIITLKEQNIIKAAINDRALNRIFYEDRNRLRADVLKEVLLALINEESE
ncbi:CtsR family transcriptional regulator [Sedimentibacter sp. zth1]|uniref:CtsR family transcriptional regulator n=1 Tax=Sedimentibacter sp. zth1 TaxID=2816908 RepID=UPI001A939A11|nr:CtsR family transcriptional regulator [Sedimentibacter sp. zth1]QSX07210.1 CtsR family transcriptional regulator [Sedimentibacter sp. zth1]